MRAILKKHFGYEEFRPLQADIITHVLARRDALVLMPTGGGKSLCFQLPALMSAGMTIVVSPLISLMKDQVDALRANGIAAAQINSAVEGAAIGEIKRQAESGRIKLLYVAPERLAIPSFRAWLKTLAVSLIAIDEAHCISEWGHDFRPDYRTLCTLRPYFPGVSVLALTATATDRVRRDIIKQLRLSQPRIFVSSFNRPNLTYTVRPKRNAFPVLVDLLRQDPHASAIIYCFSRTGTEKLADKLRRQGFVAEAYHAGLDSETRRQTQERFIRDETRIIVATIAFGMGIDKPDVRLVIHYDLPKSVENYYQETGRAGRDGLPSQCFLFWSYGDVMKHRFFIREIENPAEQQRVEEKLQQMVQYCEQRSCRRQFLLNYFGEQWTADDCRGCDICLPSVAPDVASMPAPTFDRELFEQLRQLRTMLADQRRVPPFVIFGDRSLQEMATYYPQNLASFARLYGVGQRKITDFGPQFVQLIRRHAADKNLKELARPIWREREAADTDIVSATYEETKALVKQKLSIAEIAKRRGLVTGTIMGHLEKIHRIDPALNLDYLRPESTRLAKITAAFKKTGGMSLSPVREILGEEYSYDELRLARMFVRS
ncbi:MAG: RecQ family ATP-dependent DNA helicase [Patescibacteria group bacterium]